MNRWAVPASALIGLVGAAFGLGALGAGIAVGNALLAILGVVLYLATRSLASSISRSERRRVPSLRRNASAVEALLADSEHGGTQVAVYRYGGYWQDGLRAYHVLVDGQPVGKVKEFQTLSVPVAPGLHEVQVQLSWGTSPSTVVEVGEGKTRVLECHPGSLRGVFVPGRYVDHRHVSGPHGGEP